MKAVIKALPGIDHIELKDIEKPRISDNEVLINVKAIGVCGSDVHVYTGEFPTDTPIIIGHEFSGEIVEIGKNVKSYFVGDRVISELNANSCGMCQYCRKGMFQLCESNKVLGININGCFAEYIALPERLLHKIPEHTSYEEAAIIEPAAIVTHAMVERTKIELEDIVVIFGLSAIGLISLQIAKTNGASIVMIVGKDEDKETRLKMAKELGADYVVASSKVNVKEYIDKITNGKGADLVVVCSDSQDDINTGIDILRKQGKMCVIEIPRSEKNSIQWKKAGSKDLNIVFNYSSSSNSWDTAISLLGRKAINLKPLINYRESLSNYQEVFDLMINEHIVKAVLFP